MRQEQVLRQRAPECNVASGPLEELGFVNRLAKKYPTHMNEGLFDEVGKTLHEANTGQHHDGPFNGPFGGHWFTAHPDPADLTRWNARIPFSFRGIELEASLPATAIHDRKVILFTREPIDKSLLRKAGIAFTLGFAAAFWKNYSNAILNPATIAQ